MGAAPCFFHFMGHFTSGFVPVFFRLFPVFYFIMKKKPAQNVLHIVKTTSFA